MDTIYPEDTGITGLANWTEALYADQITSGNRFQVPVFLTIPHMKTSKIEVITAPLSISSLELEARIGNWLKR